LLKFHVYLFPLFCFARRQVARAKKVEIEVKKMAARAAVLAKETTAEKSWRVFTLLIRAIPMWFVLWAWPVLAVWVWLPALSASDSKREGMVLLILGLQLVAVLIMQVSVRMLAFSELWKDSRLG
jgi:hypothetical protein